MAFKITNAILNAQEVARRTGVPVPLAFTEDLPAQATVIVEDYMLVFRGKPENVDTVGKFVDYCCHHARKSLDRFRVVVVLFDRSADVISAKQPTQRERRKEYRTNDQGEREEIKFEPLPDPPLPPNPLLGDDEDHRATYFPRGKLPEDFKRVVGTEGARAELLSRIILAMTQFIQPPPDHTLIIDGLPKLLDDKFHGQPARVMRGEKGPECTLVEEVEIRGDGLKRFGEADISLVTWALHFREDGVLVVARDKDMIPLLLLSVPRRITETGAPMAPLWLTLRSAFDGGSAGRKAAADRQKQAARADFDDQGPPLKKFKQADGHAKPAKVTKPPAPAYIHIDELWRALHMVFRARHSRLRHPIEALVMCMLLSGSDFVMGFDQLTGLRMFDVLLAHAHRLPEFLRGEQVFLNDVGTCWAFHDEFAAFKTFITEVNHDRWATEKTRAKYQPNDQYMHGTYRRALWTLHYWCNAPVAGIGGMGMLMESVLSFVQGFPITWTWIRIRCDRNGASGATPFTDTSSFPTMCAQMAYNLIIPDGQ